MSGVAKSVLIVWLLLAFAIGWCPSAIGAPIDEKAYPTLSQVITPTVDDADSEDKLFWDDAKRGWFYYEDPPDLPDPIDSEKPNPEIHIDWQAFKQLDARRINTAIEELKAYAVTYPTQENIQNYMTAQKIATGKAHQFMTVWMDVLRDHPALDETVKRPPSSFVSFNLANAESRARESVIADLARNPDVGLVMFHTNDSYYAAIQMPIVRRLIAATGWEPFRLIDADAHPETARAFGVEAIPEIWLATKDGRRARVSAGVRTADVIRESIVTAYEAITGEQLLREPYRFEETQLLERIGN